MPSLWQLDKRPLLFVLLALLLVVVVGLMVTALAAAGPTGLASAVVVAMPCPWMWG